MAHLMRIAAVDLILLVMEETTIVQDYQPTLESLIRLPKSKRRSIVKSKRTVMQRSLRSAFTEISKSSQIESRSRRSLSVAPLQALQEFQIGSPSGAANSEVPPQVCQTFSMLMTMSLIINLHMGKNISFLSRS